jgi:ribokinase
MRTILLGVNAFMPSENELRSLFWGESNDLWEMAQKIAEQGPEIVIIRRGAMGQYVFDRIGGKRYEIPAYPARLMDPTGAGPAFCGGFLAGYARTSDPLMAALHGNVSASLKIEGTGPFSPLDALSGLADARLQSLKEMARIV